jgi:flagellar biosynthetic protein FlhB
VAEDTAGDRTERATPKRREEARRKGQVARSMEINAVAVLVAGSLLLLLGGGHMATVLGRNAAYLFGQAHVLHPTEADGVQAMLAGNLAVILEALAPLLLAVMMAALLANLMQVGWHASAEALAFRGDKLDPIQGLKRLVGKRAGFELLKNLLKIGLLSWLGYLTVRGRLDELLETLVLPLPAATRLGRQALAGLLARLLLLLLVLAIADWVFQKWQHERQLRMTRSETRQEMKDTEGDPQVRARIRAIQLETARRRMLADVARADVVITNPDHLAVAVKYEAGTPAPRVVAKGRNRLAEIIKKIARQARVPVLENRPVARALYGQVRVGRLVPESLYQAVAEILAYVYRLGRS